MLTVVAVVAALGLVYFWLTNHWFARVILFIALGPVFGLVFAEVCLGAMHAGYNPSLAIALIACGWAIAWPVSRIPLYLQRQRVRQDAACRAMIVQGPAGG